MKFARVLEKNPTSGRSFLDACVMGTMSAIDEFAAPGEGLSQLLIDAVEKGQGELVDTLLHSYANPDYLAYSNGLSRGTPLRAAARAGYAAIARAMFIVQNLYLFGT